MTDRATFSVPVSDAAGNTTIARLIDGIPTYVEIDPEDQKAYTPPPTGEYNLKITGIYEPWDAPKKAEFIKPGGPTSDLKTRLEFEILDGKGKGKRFASLCTVSLGQRSNLINVWKATLGAVGSNPDIMDMLDQTVTMYIVKTVKVGDDGNERVYANPTWNTARPLGAEDDDGWQD